MKKNDRSLDAGREEKCRGEKALVSDQDIPDIKKNYLDVKVLVRSLQRSEGREDCFLTGRMDCDETDCRWRDYCLEKLSNLNHPS